MADWYDKAKARYEREQREAEERKRKEQTARKQSGQQKSGYGAQFEGMADIAATTTPKRGTAAFGSDTSRAGSFGGRASAQNMNDMALYGTGAKQPAAAQTPLTGSTMSQRQGWQEDAYRKAAMSKWPGAVQRQGGAKDALAAQQAEEKKQALERYNYLVNLDLEEAEKKRKEASERLTSSSQQYALDRRQQNRGKKGGSRSTASAQDQGLGASRRQLQNTSDLADQLEVDIRQAKDLQTIVKIEKAVDEYFRNPRNGEALAKKGAAMEDNLYTLVWDDKWLSNPLHSGLDFDYKILRNMEPDEVLTYNTLLGAGRRDDADEYLRSLVETLNYRQGNAEAKHLANTPGDLNRQFKIGMYGVGAGLDQFFTGTAQAITGDRMPTSARQFGSANVREYLKEKGGQLPSALGGGSTSQGVYDFITTTANMAPSILLSRALGAAGVSAKAAGVAGSASMGVAAAGHAYNQALAEGRTKRQARMYSTIIGVSETMLQNMIGGITAFGGVSPIVANRIRNIENGFLRVTAELGSQAFAEGNEEYWQDILEPVFRNIIYGENNAVPLWTPEATYSFLLGALSAGTMEGVSTVTRSRAYNVDGRAIKDAGLYDELLRRALAASSDTETHKLAEALKSGDTKATNYNVGELFEQYRQDGGDLAFTASVGEDAIDRAAYDYGRDVASGRVVSPETQAYLDAGLPLKTARQMGDIVQKVRAGGALTADDVRSLNLTQKRNREVFNALTGLNLGDEINRQISGKGDFSGLAGAINRQMNEQRAAQEAVAQREQQAAAASVRWENSLDIDPLIEGRRRVYDPTTLRTNRDAAFAEQAPASAAVDTVQPAAYNNGAGEPARVKLADNLPEMTFEEARDFMHNMQRERGLPLTDEAELKRLFDAAAEKDRAAKGVTNGTELDGASGEGVQRSGEQTSRRSDAATRKDRQRDLRVSRPAKLSDKAKVSLFDRGVTPVTLSETTDKAAYSKALAEARSKNEANGWAVTAQSEEDLADKTTLLSPDGGVGVVITKDGDIEGVFRDKSKHPQGKAMATALPQAIEAGGRKLDCYGEDLATLYAAYGGMKPVARVAFNPEYANDGWTPEKGQPYIYFMVATDTDASTIIEKQGTYPVPTQAELDALPTYDKDGYDDAAAYRDSLLEKQETEEGQNGSRTDTRGEGDGASASGKRAPGASVASGDGPQGVSSFRPAVEDGGVPKAGQRGSRAGAQSTGNVRQAELAKQIRALPLQTRGAQLFDAAETTRILPESELSKLPEKTQRATKRILRRAKAHSIDVYFTIGEIHVRGDSSQGLFANMKKLDPAAKNEIYLRLDHDEFTVTQLARHEFMHDLYAKDPASYQAAVDRALKAAGVDHAWVEKHIFTAYQKTYASLKNKPELFWNFMQEFVGDVNGLIQREGISDADYNRLAAEIRTQLRNLQRFNQESKAGAAAPQPNQSRVPDLSAFKSEKTNEDAYTKLVKQVADLMDELGYTVPGPVKFGLQGGQVFDPWDQLSIELGDYVDDTKSDPKHNRLYTLLERMGGIEDGADDGVYTAGDIDEQFEPYSANIEDEDEVERLQDDRRGFTPTDTEEFRRWHHDDSGRLTLPGGEPKVFARGAILSGITKAKPYQDLQSKGLFFTEVPSIATGYAEGAGYTTVTMFDAIHQGASVGEVPLRVHSSWESAIDYLNQFFYRSSDDLGLRLIPTKGGKEVSLDKATELRLVSTIESKAQNDKSGSFVAQKTEPTTVATYKNDAAGLEKFNRGFSNILESNEWGVRGVSKFYLSADKTLVIDAKGAEFQSIPFNSIPTRMRARKGLAHGSQYGIHMNDLVKRAFDMGYDCVIIDNVLDASGLGGSKKQTQYVIRDSGQVKSVYNRGSWNRNDPDFRYFRDGTEEAVDEADVAVDEADVAVDEADVAVDEADVAEAYETAKAIRMFDPSSPMAQLPARVLEPAWKKALDEKDNATAQALVVEAGRRSGWAPSRWYHGTQSFGFTAFDTSKMDDKQSIFVVDDPDTAQTYAGVPDVKPISQGGAPEIDARTASLDEIVAWYTKRFRVPDGHSLPQRMSVEDPDIFLMRVDDEVSDLRDFGKRARAFAGKPSALNQWFQKNVIKESRSKEYRNALETPVREAIEENQSEFEAAMTELLLPHLTGVMEAAAEVGDVLKEIKKSKMVTQEDERSLEFALVGLGQEIGACVAARYDLAEQFDDGANVDDWYCAVSWPLYELLTKFNPTLDIELESPVDSLLAIFDDWKLSNRVRSTGAPVISLQEDIGAGLEHGPEIYMSEEKARSMVAEEAEKLSSRGIYQLLMRPLEKPFVVSDHGGKWHSLKIDDATQARIAAYNQLRQKAYTEEHSRREDERLPYHENQRYKTREIAAIAKAFGHDGVVFEQIWDNGPMGVQHDPSNIIIAFDPYRFKSADPATFDDNGNLIPLSERFDLRTMDFRYFKDSGHEITIEGEKSNPNTDPSFAEKFDREHGPGAADQLYTALMDLMSTYGKMPESAGSVRETNLPKQTTENDRVSHTAATVAGAKPIPEARIKTIEQAVVDGKLSYVPIKNKTAERRAHKVVELEGWNEAYYAWRKDVEAGKTGAELVAVGATLLNNAANSSASGEEVIDLMTTYAQLLRSSAQATQAARILQQLTPEGKLYAIQKSVKKMNEKLAKQIEGFDPKKGEYNGIQIDPELVTRFLKAKSDAERDVIIDLMAADVASKVRTTNLDRLTAWRYLNMLGNFRTQVRNVLGNAGFQIPRMIKDSAVGIIEAGLSKFGADIERTSSVRHDVETWKVAGQIFEEYQQAILAGGKYQDNAGIDFAGKVEAKRRIFGNTRYKAWNKTVGAALERYRKATNTAMDMGDAVFCSFTFRDSLSRFMAANHTTWSEAPQALRDRAVNKAIRDAAEATYRDNNAIANYLSKAMRGENTPMIFKVIGEGVLPFRKTPANILMRAYEYSPLSIVGNTITDIQKARGKSEVTGNEIIEQWAKTLTGTGLMALGVALASFGYLIGKAPDDDKEKALFDQEGKQAYSLVYGGHTYTIDWLAPESIPLFLGANIAQEGLKKGLSLKEVLDATMAVGDPIFEMSMLQGINDALESIGTYGAQNALMAFVGNSAVSFLSQFTSNTLAGQIERAVSNQRDQTYVDKNSSVPTEWQSAIGKWANKVPFWDYNQIPYIDAWGDVQQNSTPAKGNRVDEVFSPETWNAITQIFSPAYVSTKKQTETLDEIRRLYKATGDDSIILDRAPKYFTVDNERKDLTAAEYVTYATTRGQTAKAEMARLVSSAAYKAMSDAEKIEAISRVYEYANEKGKAAVSDYEPKKWVLEAEANAANIGVPVSTYTQVYAATKDIAGFKDRDGKTVSNSWGLQVMEAIYNTPGLTEEQAKKLAADLGVGKTVLGYNKARVTRELKAMRRKYDKD